MFGCHLVVVVDIIFLHLYVRGALINLLKFVFFVTIEGFDHAQGPFSLKINKFIPPPSPSDKDRSGRALESGGSHMQVGQAIIS